MVFSSLLFLWLFLPVVVAGYYIVPSKCKNILLLISSLLFMPGEPVYILLMLFFHFFNWGTGLLIDRFRKIDRILLAVNVVGNLALFGFFKYYDFFIGWSTAVSKRRFRKEIFRFRLEFLFLRFRFCHM